MLKLSERSINYLKLFLTGIILIWLYIRSPLNPLYSDSTPGEWAFVKLNFIYWILVSVFLIWIIYFVNKKNFDRYSLFIFTAANFLYISFYIFYGFDVIDSGFHLSKQWSMYNGLWGENFDSIAGTNLIGGLWLKLYGEPMLIWARLGFVIVQTLIVFVSYKIMLLYFKPRQIFFVMLPVSLFLASWYYYQTINYYNLPYLFFVSSIYFLLKSTVDDKKNNQLLYSGIMYVVAVFCKIAYAPSILLHIFVIYLYGSIVTRNGTKRGYISLLYGILFGLSLAALLLFVIEEIGSYLNNFTEVIKEFLFAKDQKKIHGHDHSFSRLYFLYKNDIINIFRDLLNFVFLFFITEYIVFKTKKIQYLKYIIPVICFLSLYIVIFAKFSRYGYGNFTENDVRNLISFILALLVLYVFFTEKEKMKESSILVLCSFGLFVFSYIGSDLSVRAAYHSGGSIMIFTLPIILLRYSQVSFLGCRFRFNFLIWFALISFSYNITTKKDNLYREYDFKYLTKPFESSVIKGIKSNPRRVDVVDSLLLFMNKIPELSSRRIMFTHSNPLMYYLTGANYFLESPWDLTSDYYSFEESLYKNQPDFFVLPKITHRIDSWPYVSQIDSAEVSTKYYDLYEKFKISNSYNLIYKNSFYSVFGLNREHF